MHMRIDNESLSIFSIPGIVNAWRWNV